MRHKILVGILYSCLSLSATGCSFHENTPSQSEYEEETIALSEHEQEESTQESISEPLNYYEDLIAAARAFILNENEDFLADYDFSSVLKRSGEDIISGYMIVDIDGNGIDELIHVLNGWERNRYYLCENGMIANEGSSSADNSSFSAFTFEDSKIHLAESVIYDGIKDAENPWFYSTVSEYDAENAEPISKEKATKIMEKYVYEHPVFTPFVEDGSPEQ